MMRVIAPWVAALAFASCGEDELARLEVQVTFPSPAAQNVTSSLHVWALRPGDPDAGMICATLVGGTVGPYILSAERLADAVFLLPSTGNPTLSGLRSGPALVYVEAVDAVGRTHLAGCATADLGTDAVVTITLGATGNFDCADPATPENAPCEDGMVCTVGETCQGGTCRGGGPRDCTYVADACNGGSCTEAMGCVKVPLANGTPCEDGLFCSNGDVCQGGVCSGAARDCSVGIPQCRTAACSESMNQCVTQFVPAMTPCDDGLYCTVNEACSSFGSCNGMARDCSAVANQCNTASCNETMNACVAAPRPNGWSCNDSNTCTSFDVCTGGVCAGTPLTGPACNDGNVCTSGDSCSAGTCVAGTPITGPSCNDGDACTMNEACSAGVCSGGTATDADGDTYRRAGCPGPGLEDCDDTRTFVNPTATEGPMGSPTCTDGLDNDCDTLMDGLDPGCT